MGYTAFSAISSVSGTALQIDTTSGQNPVISIDASYPGQTSFTELGTIVTGQWEATPVAVQWGGTGNSTFTAYSIICAGTTALGEFQNVVGVGTAGQVLVSSGASALPVWSNTTGSSWVDQTTGSVTMVANTSYVADDAALVTLTLPAVAAFGSTFQIVGKGAGGWKIAQNASQYINFGDVVTTTGTGGYLASTNSYDCVQIVCVTANTEFVAYNSVGNITYN